MNSPSVPCCMPHELGVAKCLLLQVRRWTICLNFSSQVAMQDHTCTWWSGTAVPQIYEHSDYTVFIPVVTLVSLCFTFSFLSVRFFALVSDFYPYLMLFTDLLILVCFLTMYALSFWLVILLLKWLQKCIKYKNMPQSHMPLNNV